MKNITALPLSSNLFSLYITQRKSEFFRVLLWWKQLSKYSGIGSRKYALRGMHDLKIFPL